MPAKWIASELLAHPITLQGERTIRIRPTEEVAGRNSQIGGGEGATPVCQSGGAH